MTVWFVSDTHFGHTKTCTHFLRADGRPLRPFATVEEMDRELIARWNARVRQGDKVYHLGDVCLSRKSLAIMAQLSGDKVLIRGNHDIFGLDEYHEYFRDVRGVWELEGMVLTHIPMHPSSLDRWGVNVHGHTHADSVMRARGVDVRTGEILYSDHRDPRYVCVSVEQTEFAPISLEEVRARLTDC